MCVIVLFPRMPMLLYQIFYSPVSTLQQRVILIHWLYVSYFPPLLPSCCLLVGTFGWCTVAQFLLNCSWNVWTFSVRSCSCGWKNKKRWAKTNIGCWVSHDADEVCIKSVRFEMQCPLHLLIIKMCVVTWDYYLWVWAYSLIYFTSFGRNENEVTCSLINLKV